MVNAIVIIDAENNRIPEVASAVAAISGVSETFSVTGDIDIIAIIRVDQYEDLADVISDKIAKIPGVRSTRTHLAFQTFSPETLEEAFSIGLD